VAEKNLVIAVYDPDTGQWQELESTVDVENNTVTAKVSHFSTFAVLAYTRPASFEITDFAVTPVEVDPGSDININVLVTNTGDLTGSYEVYLRLDGSVIQTREVTLNGGDSKMVSFSAASYTAGEHKAGIGGSLTLFTVKAPAAFTTHALNITPGKVNLGDSATIEVLVSNTGGITGSYELSLNLNGGVIQTREVTLNAGDSATVSFSVTPDSIGKHEVNIGDLLAVLEVEAPAPPGTEEVASAELGISGFNITPIYDTLTGTLLSARVDYQINGTEAMTPAAELILKVLLEGEPLEEVQLLILSQLQPDRNTGSLSYIPSRGWNDGTYDFQIELREGDRVIQSTLPENFTLIQQPATAAVVSWQTLGVIIGIVVLLAILIVGLVLYRRRDMLRDYRDYVDDK
jgi:hypothetical protein